METLETRNDFFTHIAEPTAQVNIGADAPEPPAGTLGLSADDFDRNVPVTPIIPNEPDTVPIDAQFTTEFIIDFFEGTQEPAFYFLNQSRQRKKYFADRDEYLEAVELSYKTDDELKKAFPEPEDYDKKHALVLRLKEMNSKLEKVKKDLPFTDDERHQLERPLKKMVEKANLDIPPGLAMVMVVSKIMSARIIDLYAD
jgi:hypothetical protein